MLLAVVHALNWKRVIADIGPGSESVKVYFDHGAGGSGKQRDFAECSVWETCRYKPIEGEKVRLVAAMYVWVLAAGTTDITSRESHLAFDPTLEEVASILHKFRMVAF